MNVIQKVKEEEELEEEKYLIEAKQYNVQNI